MFQSAELGHAVDKPTYKAEVLYQTYRRKVRPASHYSLGWLPRWARAASLAPKVANLRTSGHLRKNTRKTA